MIRQPAPEHDATTIALQALVWAIADEDRAARLLSLTGLDAGELRARAIEPELLAAMLGFLEAHEPDLVACADALDVMPGDLVAARQQLDR